MEISPQYFSRLPWTPYRDTMIRIHTDITQQPNIRAHSLSQFARKYNMSESTLKRSFKASFKKPLHKMVTAICMERALWLLKDSVLSVEEMAAVLGYQEKSGFIRAFKRYYGKTPKQS